MSAIPKLFSIADLGILCFSEHASFFKGFEDRGNTESILKIPENAIQSSYGICYPSSSLSHYLSNADSGVLVSNEDWSEVLLYNGGAKDPKYALMLAAICSRFAAFGTVLLHGSFVDYEGNGIVFTGPSGIGKTTQAELWHKHLGADIVNGDKVLVRYCQENFFTYGLPWKGSSPYCLNRKAPVRAIVALRQAESNRIHKLTNLECMEYFMPHVFLPRWDQDCLCLVLDTLDQILKHVPIWLLECAPNADAVTLTRDSVF